MSILALFGFSQDEPQPAGPQTDTVRKIVEQLDRMEPQHARFLAAFAYILSRVARADLKVTSEETQAMEQMVARQGGIPEEQARVVVQIAQNQNLLFGATEDFLVTREFNRISTPEQKLALLDCLFGVAAAENLVSLEEDNAIRQIAHELGLSHQDFIAVRSRYRDQLSILQRKDD